MPGKSAARVVLYGESWRGTMPASVLRALGELGLEAHLFDFTRFLPQYRFPGNLVCKVAARVGYPWFCQRISKAFEHFCRIHSPDLVLVFKGIHLLPESLRTLARSGVRLANWSPDDLLNPLNTSRNLLESLGEYDWVFNGRPHRFDAYQRAGCKTLVFLEWCYDESVHYPVTVSSAERSRFDAQISFAGSWSRKRERYVEALLEAGFALRVWGAQWHHAGRRLSRRGVLQCREARAEDFSRVCRASGLVLNLLTEENYDSSNLRVFEVGACGGTLFSERSERIVATLGPHSEAFLFQDPSQAVERARILLEDAPQRAGWAGELHHRLTCQGRNTFLARTREIIERTQLQCRSFTA